MKQKYGDVFKFMLGGCPTVVVADADSYRKVSSITTRVMYIDTPNDQQGTLSYNIFSSNGKIWEDVRKLEAPAFSVDQVSTYFETVRESMEEELVQIGYLEGQEIGLLKILKEPFYVATMKGFFGTELSLKNPKDKFLIEQADKQMFNGQFVYFDIGINPFLRAYLLFPEIAYAYFKLINLLGLGRQHWGKSEYSKSLKLLMMQKRAHSTQSVDQCNQFEKNNNNYNNDNSDKQFLRQLRRVDPFVNFKDWKEHKGDGLLSKLFKYGRIIGQSIRSDWAATNEEFSTLTALDSPPNVVTYAIRFLSYHKLKQQKLLQEIDQFGKDRKMTYSNIDEFPYCKAVLLETLRLCTPDVANYRRTERTMQLKGYQIPKDTRIILGTTAVHHNEQYWPKSEEFHPERFLGNEELSSRIPNAFYAFGFGPRSCQGQKLSYMLMITALVMIYQKYVFKFKEEQYQDVKFYNTFMLQPITPLEAILQARS